MVRRNETTDTRVVYGFHCSWWGGIEEAGKHHSGTPHLPGCPVCGNGLMQVDNAKAWWDAVDRKDKEIPGYRDFISWLKGKCFRNRGEGGIEAALAAYNAKPGRVKVILPPRKPT